MIRLPVIGFLIFHALLSYVDSTSILPHVPGNVQPFGEHSKDAPAKKLLRADETKENEERVGLGFFNYPINMWHEWRQYTVIQKILLPKDRLKHNYESISAALALKDTKAVLKKFENNENKLVDAFNKHYDGVGLVVSSLSRIEREKTPKAHVDRQNAILVENAKSLWDMELKSLENKNLDYIGAFNELKLKEVVKENGPLLFDGRVTFLEAYIARKLTSTSPKIKIDVDHIDKIHKVLFETLEKGFGGMDKFLKLITEEIQKYGNDYKTNSVMIGGSYEGFLYSLKDVKRGLTLLETMEKVHGRRWNKKYEDIKRNLYNVEKENLV